MEKKQVEYLYKHVCSNNASTHRGKTLQKWEKKNFCQIKKGVKKMLQETERDNNHKKIDTSFNYSYLLKRFHGKF
jgi:hypothetical protein